jgi:hypothetical protein
LKKRTKRKIRKNIQKVLKYFNIFAKVGFQEESQKLSKSIEIHDFQEEDKQNSEKILEKKNYKNSFK